MTLSPQFTTAAMIAAWLSVSGAVSAHASPADNPGDSGASAAKAAQERGDTSYSDIAFYCHPERSSLVIASAPVAKPGEGYQRRQPDLQDSGASPEQEYSCTRSLTRQAKVKAASISCGEISVSVRRGFYSAQPNGELDMADDYALLTIWRNKKRLAGPLAIGECVIGNPRYSTYAACPENWASRVDIDASEDKPRIKLQHTYHELTHLSP